jgi:tetratricopeptide (TPR) repeat protein
MFRIIHRALLAMLIGGAVASTAAGQQDGVSRDSIFSSAAQLLGQGRVNEARILLLRAMRASHDPTETAEYRIRIGDTFLYGGQYDQASRAYNAVLDRDHVPAGSSVAREAHHGLALVEAFNGRSGRAATHYAEALRGGSLRDTIEMLVMTNQNDSAQKALDRLAASRTDAETREFVQTFRGLSWMMAGHCTEALPEIAKAPQGTGPISVAVRGRCAMKHGQRPDALVLKDAVLKQSEPDPFSWTTLIARDAARKIE